MARRLRAIGVRMIDNDRVFLTPAKTLADTDDRNSLCLAGFGDLKADTVDALWSVDGWPHWLEII